LRKLMSDPKAGINEAVEIEKQPAQTLQRCKRNAAYWLNKLNVSCSRSDIRRVVARCSAASWSR
jgi:hypothetical protein